MSEAPLPAWQGLQTPWGRGPHLTLEALSGQTALSSPCPGRSCCSDCPQNPGTWPQGGSLVGENGEVRGEWPCCRCLQDPQPTPPPTAQTKGNDEEAHVAEPVRSLAGQGLDKKAEDGTQVALAAHSCHLDGSGHGGVAVTAAEQGGSHSGGIHGLRLRVGRKSRGWWWVVEVLERRLERGWVNNLSRAVGGHGRPSGKPY